MKKSIWLFVTVFAGLLAACGTPVPTMAPKLAASVPTIISPTGYRPIQAGDEVEGATISYQYVVPSLEKPAVLIALGANLLQLVVVKTELAAGLVTFIQELPKDQSVYAFDENDPQQTEPKLMTWDARKPVELAFIALPQAKRSWSVTEVHDNEIQAAYKIIRRKDGGLRFVDAYGFIALQSANNTFTLNGGGTGLMFSARLALLQVILSDTQYQRGENVIGNHPPSLSQYDARVLKIDPARTGLAMNQDWVLFSRPGPNPGMVAP